MSDYQRWAHSTTQPLVDAGEDIRWAPRRLLSSVAMPGNDFYLIDDRLVVFMGTIRENGQSTGIVSSTAPTDLAMCRSAFTAVWRYAIPHRDYRPR